MPKRTTEHAAAAKMIRQELKKNNIPATVRSKSYAGGCSIRVCIQQDVLPATLRQIQSYCNQFQWGHFDGMQDLYVPSNARNDIPQVSFVFVDVDYSQAFLDEVREYVARIGGIKSHRRWEYENLVIRGEHWGRDFWAARKPKVTTKPATMHPVQ